MFQGEGGRKLFSVGLAPLSSSEANCREVPLDDTASITISRSPLSLVVAQSRTDPLDDTAFKTISRSSLNSLGAYRRANASDDTSVITLSRTCCNLSGALELRLGLRLRDIHNSEFWLPIPTRQPTFVQYTALLLL